MDLRVGGVVAYPPHGVGRITAREKRVVLGVEEEVIIVELGNELSVSLPLSRAQEQLRAPASEADLKKVQKALRENGVVSDEIWSKRVQYAQEKLRSGDPLELAEIVRDGVRREQGKTANGTPTKLSTSERALHLKARELLSGEISVTRGLDQAEADAWIDEQLAKAPG
jgi:CarD family transcriptional regulator